jgi:purine catabolism regulator
LLRAARLPLLRWATAARADAAADVTALPLRADAAGAACGWRRLVVRVSAGPPAAGFISVISPEGAGHTPCEDSHSGQTSASVRLALQAAALAASIEALRLQARAEARGGAVAGLAHDWLSGRLGSAAEVRARAAQVAVDLAPPYAVLIVECERPPGADGARRLVRRLARALAKAPAGPAARTAPAAPDPAAEPLWVAVDDRRTAVVLSHTTSVHVETAIPEVHRALMAGEDGAYAGIGRIAARAEDVPRAYREALQALAVASRLASAHRVAYFGALGAYRVLAATDPDELASFYADVLGPLHAQHGKGGAELLRTLDTYLLCGGSPQETAQRLHTHRNTILYRLERIAQTLAVDVRHPETQLTLFLALRAADILGAAGVERATARTRPPEVA